MLFIFVNVNDLVDDLITLPYLFADDTSLFTVIDPIDTEITFNQINRDLQVLHEWSFRWRVTFNASKTVYMVISNKPNPPDYPDLYLNRVKLKKVSSHKHLGIILTHNMKWGIHIDDAISKANKRLNGIRRIRFLITREARILLYKALVLPVLEYGNVLYDNCTMYLKNRLESIQRKAAIVCTGAFRNSGYGKLMAELGWATLEMRRKYFRMCIMYKMINNLAPEYLCGLLPLRVRDRANRQLRNGNNLSLIRTNHVKTYNSFLPKTTRDWNLLGAIRGSKSVETFKNAYKNANFNSANPAFNIDLYGANIHLTRMRLGLSHLAEHLYTHNIVDDPLCNVCGLETESTAHYLLRCPLYAAERAVFLSDLLDILEPDTIANLNDNDMVNLFLFGNEEFPYECNVSLATMALTYIPSTTRFTDRAYY